MDSAPLCSKGSRSFKLAWRYRDWEKRERMIYFKELDLLMMKADNSETCRTSRLEIHWKIYVAVGVKRQPRGRICFSSVYLSFSLKVFNSTNEAPLHYYFALLKITYLNITVFSKYLHINIQNVVWPNVWRLWSRQVNT